MYNSQDINTFLRPFLPWHYPDNPQESQSQKTNLNPMNILKKIEESENKKKIGIGLSPIGENEKSNFFDENSVMDFFDNVPKYGPLGEIKKKVNKIKVRTVHMKMDNFDDYYSNFCELVKPETKYNYYFIYNDIDNNFSLQVQFQDQKEIYFSKLRNCEFIEPIKDYDFLESIMENNKLIDISINIDLVFLNFGRGPRGGKKNPEINKKIIQYCYKKNIDLFKEFQ